MTTRDKILKQVDLRRIRTFSTDFKCKKVQEIEQGLTSVSDICKEYAVSKTAVYKWIHQYSQTMSKKERTIVEAKSDTRKIQSLKLRIAELERSLGQKQLQIDFFEKMIQLAEEEYQVDIKKKFGGKR